jgi:hypothetical protein
MKQFFLTIFQKVNLLDKLKQTAIVTKKWTETSIPYTYINWYVVEVFFFLRVCRLQTSLLLVAIGMGWYVYVTMWEDE